MSEPKRIKPPPLKLGEFAAPPNPILGRPSFYSEESTMITALSDLEREQIAKSKGPANSRESNVQVQSNPGPPKISRPPAISTFEDFAPGSVQAPPPIDADVSDGVQYLETSQIDPADIIELNEQLQSTSFGANTEEQMVVDAHDLPQMHRESHHTDTSGEEKEYAQSALRATDVIGNGIMVVFNVRGGVGASTLAVNVAGAAQYYGKRIALIDLDLQLGSLSSMLDGKPLERSLAELVMETSEAARPEITSAIDERAGLSLIAQEGRIGEIGLVTPDRLPRFLEAVKAQHDLVIIDGVRSFSDHAVTVMDIADTILLVVTQDVPAIRSARKVLSLIRRLGYRRDKVRLVLNRHNKRSPFSVEEIEDRLDQDVYEVLPSNFKFVSNLIEQGQLARDVDLKHEITIGFDRLASRLLGLEPLEEQGFFSKLFSKRSR